MARPSEFLQATFDEICFKLEDGESLRSICQHEAMPNRSTVYDWMRGNKLLTDQYTRAKVEGCNAMAEDAISIADDGSNDWMASNDPLNPGYEFRGEHVQRSKLRVDTRKWYTSKIAPKLFGDRTAVELSGSVDIAQSILAARKRVAKKDDIA